MIQIKSSGIWIVFLVSGCLLGGVTPLFAQSTETRPPGINNLISNSDSTPEAKAAIVASRERLKQMTALEAKADTLLKQGKTEEAMAAYRQAIAIDWGSGYAAVKLATILFDQGNFKDVAVTYKQIFYSDKDKAWVNIHGGNGDDLARAILSFHKIGDRASAIGAYEFAASVYNPDLNVQHDPTLVPLLAHFDDTTPQFAYTPERMEAVTLTLLAVVKYRFSGGVDMGIEYFTLLRRAIQLWPQYAQAHYYLAEMLISYARLNPPYPDRKERIQEAVKELQSALSNGDLTVRAGVRQLQKERAALLNLGGS